MRLTSRAKALIAVMTVAELLGIELIILRLADVIAWPWWIVLSPLYVPVALVLLGLAAAVRVAANSTEGNS